jgi:hypothetical protein
MSKITGWAEAVNEETDSDSKDNALPIEEVGEDEPDLFTEAVNSNDDTGMLPNIPNEDEDFDITIDRGYREKAYAPETTVKNEPELSPTLAANPQIENCISAQDTVAKEVSKLLLKPTYALDFNGKRALKCLDISSSELEAIKLLIEYTGANSHLDYSPIIQQLLAVSHNLPDDQYGPIVTNYYEGSPHLQDLIEFVREQALSVGSSQ